MKDKKRKAAAFSFNRYIVECKYLITEKNQTYWQCFNRYIVECKYTHNIPWMGRAILF